VELETSGESFFEFAKRMSKAHKAYFLDLYPPNEARLRQFREAADASLERQADLERADTVDFDQYLANYFAAK
jgi:glutamate--cysteine ligase